MQCPSETTLADFVEERLPKDEERAIGEHMDACAECRATVALTTRALFADEKGEELPGAFGTTVSHYVILNVLGAGAMGIVYAAHDPRLDRKVALKLLREQEGEPDLAARAKRLLREAQSMAKLTHPNVVAVYDVGTVQDRLFLAMEFVDGMSLSEWLRTEPRSWRDVLDVFVKAGEGLAAAHAAGVVHRDFKPDNVLVSFDGQVKVTDFGLARSVLAKASVDKPSVGGTPAYMAPEQARGEATDARSDQYSFAVSLFEALEGGRPSAVAARKAPAHVHKVLARALSTEPEKRYPSMDAMLAALRGSPSTKKRLVFAAPVVVALAGAIALFVSRGESAEQKLCGGAERKLAGVWDKGRKDAVRAAFGATGLPYAKDTSERVERGLDAYTAAWGAMHKDACEATHVYGEQSERLLDERMECLGERLSAARATIDVFAKADPEIVDKAVSSVDALPKISDCANATKLRAAKTRRASDPATLARVGELEPRLSEVRALYEAGKYNDALPKARAVLDEARKLHHPPLEVAAAWQLGRVHGQLETPDETEPLLLEAVAGAEAIADYETAAQIWIDLAYFVGSRAAKLEAGQRFVENAKKDIERAGGNDEIEAQRLHRLALLYAYAERFDEALPLFDKALALLEKTHAGPALTSRTLDARAGFALRMVGRLDDALALERQSIDLGAAAYGAAHPTMALRWNNLGQMQFEKGQYKEALESLEESVRINEKALGPNYLHIFFPLVTRAQLLLAVDHDEEAMKSLEQAERVQRESGKKARPDVQVELEVATSTYLRRHGQAAKAQEHAKQALAIADKTYGQKSASTAMAHAELSRVAVAAGKPDDAVVEGRQARAVLDALPTEQPTRAVDTLLALGEALVAARAHGEAIGVLERARTIGASRGLDPFKSAYVDFVLAGALWDSGGDRARAHELAKGALDTYAKEPLFEAKRAEIGKWLARRP